MGNEMYLFIDEDGDITKAETADITSPVNWPSIIKVEIEGMDIKVSHLNYDGQWLAVKDDDGSNA